MANNTFLPRLAKTFLLLYIIVMLVVVSFAFSRHSSHLKLEMASLHQTRNPELP